MLLSPLFFKEKRNAVRRVPLTDEEIEQLEQAEKEYHWLSIGIGLSLLGLVALSAVNHLFPKEVSKIEHVYQTEHIQRKNFMQFTINEWNIPSTLTSGCANQDVIRTLESLKGKKVNFIINERLLDELSRVVSVETQQDINWC